MTAYAALLRAVNVGGAKISMADLREVGTDAGLDSVRTHLNSGNLLFEAAADTPREYAASVSRLLTERVGRPVPVIVRSVSQLRRAADQASAAYPDAADSTLAVAFLDRPVLDVAPDRLGEFGDDRYLIDADAVYLHYPHGQARTKLLVGVVEKGLGAVATVRGLRSVHGMVNMMTG